MRFLFVFIIQISLIMPSVLKAQRLKSFNWSNRIILVFEDPVDKEPFEKQIKELKSDPEGLQERKILIFTITDEVILDQDGKKYDIALLEEVRKLQSITNKFELVLIGLDGGIKLRVSERISPDVLYSLIDGMPLRQAEFQRKKN